MEKKDYFYKVTKKSLDFGTVHVKAYSDEQARDEVNKALKEGKFDERLDLNKAPALVEVTELPSRPNLTSKFLDYIEVPDEKKQYAVIIAFPTLTPGNVEFTINVHMDLVDAMRYSANKIDAYSKCSFGSNYVPFIGSIFEFMKTFNINPDTRECLSRIIKKCIDLDEIFMLFVEDNLITKE